MNVQQKGNRHDSSYLIERLARRIMDHFGPDHWWKETDSTWRAAYGRASDMTDAVLFRYTEDMMLDGLDLDQTARGIVGVREESCCECYCGFECNVDHSAHITLRDVMIYMMCEAVVEEIDEARWDYFDEVA
ncbi:hypothetical protein KKC88_04465 [Patescibacteria group bacterium]|nr:hypothetical protein [Patescibacteria group bacterium]MBU1673986.1 hypothetical protein [Patescibacteria group bacterium]MBU1962941.1 hypothetical protein [Patescibacteria group bacterium]